MKRLIALAALLVSACATAQVPQHVSKAYYVDVCVERDDPAACEAEASRIAEAQCPNGLNDMDAYLDDRRWLHVDVGCD